MPRDKAHMTASQLANLRPWKKGEAPKSPGRPRNRVNDLLKDVLPKKKAKRLNSLTVDEINTIERTMGTLDTADLQAIAKADKTFAYMKTLAIAAIVDMKNGRTQTMDKLRDRQYGAVTQNVDVTSGGNPISQGQPLSQADAVKLLQELESKY